MGIRLSSLNSQGMYSFRVIGFLGFYLNALLHLDWVIFFFVTFGLGFLVDCLTILDLSGAFAGLGGFFFPPLRRVTKVHPSSSSFASIWEQALPPLPWGFFAFSIIEAKIIGLKDPNFMVLTNAFDWGLPIVIETKFDDAVSSSNSTLPSLWSSMILSFNTKHFSTGWLIKQWYLQ